MINERLVIAGSIVANTYGSCFMISNSRCPAHLLMALPFYQGALTCSTLFRKSLEAERLGLNHSHLTRTANTIFMLNLAQAICLNQAFDRLERTGEDLIQVVFFIFFVSIGCNSLIHLFNLTTEVNQY